jgi:hypothetical protein
MRARTGDVLLGVTKYDPRFRNEAGHYLRDEWTEAWELGTNFADGVLTREEYLRVESLYVAAVSRFWKACGAPPLQIQGLEWPPQDYSLDEVVQKKALEVGPPQDNSLDEVGFDDWRPVNGDYVPAARVEAMVRWCLRNLGWCQLVADGVYIHFGTDYYMWLGAEESADDALQQIAADGLFVEMCESPYQRGAPTEFWVEACRIGEQLVDHTFVLSDLPAIAIADLWPEVPAVIGYRERSIDVDLAARIRRYADITFDFGCFTYSLFCP